MILLQAETAGFFDAMMQQGIAFGLMSLVIIVLARRIIKLEAKIDGMIEDKFEEAKEQAIIIKDATEAMKESNKNKCHYDGQK